MIPSYLRLYDSGEIKQRAKIFYEKLKSCNLCPRNCQVNRLSGELGYCKATLQPKVSS